MKMPGARTIKKLLYPINRLGIVLMYHRVADPHYDPLRLNVTPAHLKEHMQVLKKYGRPVKMQEMGDTKRFPNGKIDIAVTLDDGYSDNFNNARPVFQQTDVSATFFIISGAVDNHEEFFWDGLKSTILQPETLPQTIEITVSDKKYRWELTASGPCQTADYGNPIAGIPSNGSKLSRFQLYSTILHLLGPLSAQQRRDVISQLEQWAGQNLTVRKDYLPMSSTDLKTLSDSKLFEIGAHTVNHPQLANLPLQQQEKEIAQSKIELENKINTPILSFSYPHGSFIKETVEIVKRSKFTNACTVVPKQVMRGSAPYLIPRFSVDDCDGDGFEKKLREWLARTN